MTIGDYHHHMSDQKNKSKTPPTSPTKNEKQQENKPKRSASTGKLLFAQYSTCNGCAKMMLPTNQYYQPILRSRDCLARYCWTCATTRLNHKCSDSECVLLIGHHGWLVENIQTVMFSLSQMKETKKAEEIKQQFEQECLFVTQHTRPPIFTCTLQLLLKSAHLLLSHHLSSFSSASASSSNTTMITMKASQLLTAEQLSQFSGKPELKDAFVSSFKHSRNILIHF